MSELRKLHATRIAHYEEGAPVREPSPEATAQTTVIVDRSGNVKDAVLEVITSRVDGSKETLVAQLSRISDADLSNKEGRKSFANACSQARKIEGMQRSASGRNTPSQFSSKVADALQANLSLQGYLTVQDERTAIDVRGLTPKVISALRHLIQNTEGISVEDGFRIDDVDPKSASSSVSVELKDGERIDACIALVTASPYQKPQVTYLSNDKIYSLLRSAQDNDEWVIFIGDEEFKLGKESIAIPNAQKLIARGRKDFLFVINTLLERVLYQQKGVSMNNVTVRVRAVPPEAGEAYLAAVKKLAELPLANLKALGQRRVVGLDKNNNHLFENLQKRASEADHE